jgi:HlyD family secretion protein
MSRLPLSALALLALAAAAPGASAASAGPVAPPPAVSVVYAVTQILAEEGDRVAAGQVLARLSSDLPEAELAQADAQMARAAAAIDQAQGAIAEAQANKTEADAAYGRARSLVTSGSTSRETYDEKLAAAQMAGARLQALGNALKVAQADLAVAQAQRREAAVRLARTEIRTPVAGVVSRRTARIGAVVSQSGEPLFRIIQGGAVELEGEVPEALLNQLRPGQPAQIFVPGRDAPLPGRVRLVAPEVDASTRLGRVRLTVQADPPPAIGGFGRGTVEVARHEGVLVPLSAVLFEPAGVAVQVVRDGVVQTRQVALGLQDEGRAEIAHGLAPGERVVAISGTFVRDGDRVVAVPATLGGS